MMVFKKAIPRRTFLRGVGATLALPMLDSMVPAFADSVAKPPVRLATVYVPNGMWPMDKWTPKTEGAGFEITPTMEPLAAYRDQMLVLSGLNHNEARDTAEDAAGPHSTACASYLTGIRPKRTAGKDLHAGTSMDQIAAQELGKHTQLGSLEVSLFAPGVAGYCEPGYSCVYLSTISWASPSTPLPMEYNPRAMFERMFGDGDTTDSAARLARMQERHSILDSVSQDVSRLLTGIAPGDRGKLADYLDSIRDVEKRIQTAEEQASREVPTVERPVGVPAAFQDYNKLMCDLQVLAFQCDLTRVITFMIAREGPYNSRAYPEIGIPDEHHALSHHQDDPPKIAKLFQINVYHAKLFAYYLEKLKSTPDGDGSLLDHSIVLYGSALGNGNGHTHVDLPTMLLGGGAGQIKGGRHIRYSKDTPMTNLHLTILDKLGVPVDHLGDSTGKLELLSV